MRKHQPDNRVGVPLQRGNRVIVPVNASTQTPRMTTAPIGAGRTIDATMVARKMASSRHPCGVMPSGGPAMSTAVATLRTSAQRHADAPRSR